MREITPVLTAELAEHVGSAGVGKSDGYPIATYRELVEHTARLAYLNKDHLLFFRGQSRDFQNRAGASTFYPSIYRVDNLRKDEVIQRFKILDRAANQLKNLFVRGQIEGHRDISRKRYVQWSLLQHYEVADTPLLDFTQSPRVACSFAMSPDGDDWAYAYVFGLPYVTNRISINSEQDTVLLRLLSISPPTALRPYFQEGYLAATADVTTDYDDKNELDFNHRLIAKFVIPNSQNFWGEGLRGLSAEELYPNEDAMKELCSQIRIDRLDEDDPGISIDGSLGAFITAWAQLERLIMRLAQRDERRIVSLSEAIRRLRVQGRIEPWTFETLEEIRKFRNAAVHGHSRETPYGFQDMIEQVKRIRVELDRQDRDRPGLRP